MSEKTRAEAEREFAAARRADYVRALEEERDGCKRVGKAERVRAIEAELKRVRSVAGRSSTEPDPTPDPPAAPPVEQTAAPKPRTARRTRKG